MGADLSPRQALILDFVRAHWKYYGYGPSVREIRFGCGISSESVADYNLRALARRGLMRRGADLSARTWAPVVEPEDDCPMCGRQGARDGDGTSASREAVPALPGLDVPRGY